jgi:hypothetical protein
MKQEIFRIHTCSLQSVALMQVSKQVPQSLKLPLCAFMQVSNQVPQASLLYCSLRFDATIDI